MRIYRTIPRLSESPSALTIGNFDGVHRGHQAMLRELTVAARSRGLPAAVMTFEPHPREFFAPDKAPARLTSLREKLELLRHYGVERLYLCRFDYAFAQTPPEDFIRRILVDGLGVRWLQVGDDFRFGARRAGDYAMLRSAAPQFGFEVHSLPTVVVDGVRASSTAVRDALAAGDCDRAAQLLGRPYSISGRIVRGDQLGRKLGFPTANVQMKRLRPALSGIFAVAVHGLGPAPVEGAASLGVRPTVTARGVPTLEVNLFDFSRDVYRAHVRVDFLRKLRDEEKYSDLDTLRRQIALDVENAKAFLRSRRETAHRGTGS